MRQRAAARDRQPAKLHREHDRKERTEPEIRNRNARQRERHGAVIHRGAAPDRGHHAQGNRQGDGNGHRSDRQLCRRGKALEDHRRDRLPGSKRFPEITGNGLPEERDVLLEERPIETKAGP